MKNPKLMKSPWIITLYGVIISLFATIVYDYIKENYVLSTYS